MGSAFGGGSRFPFLSIRRPRLSTRVESRSASCQSLAAFSMAFLFLSASTCCLVFLPLWMSAISSGVYPRILKNIGSLGDTVSASSTRFMSLRIAALVLPYFFMNSASGIVLRSSANSFTRPSFIKARRSFFISGSASSAMLIPIGNRFT